MSASIEKKTFYDHFSQDRPTRLGMWLVGGISERIFEFAQIGEGHSVLEIGPGRGAFAALCLEKGVEYWAIEPNEEMADHLRKQDVNVISSIVPPLPEIGRTFDVVVMNSVIEHMDTMMAALELTRQVYGLLNPGGKFVMYAPDYANWRHHFFVGDFSHSYITSWRRLEELLISGGFKDIRGCYQSATFRGVLCLLISGIAAWLPFAWLDVVFPRSRVARKLYKVQIAFLRRVLILGTKKGEAFEDKA